MFSVKLEHYYSTFNDWSHNLKFYHIIRMKKEIKYFNALEIFVDVYKIFATWILFFVNFSDIAPSLYRRIFTWSIQTHFSMIPSYFKTEIFEKYCSWITLSTRGLNWIIAVFNINFFTTYIFNSRIVKSLYFQKQAIESCKIDSNAHF